MTTKEKIARALTDIIDRDGPPYRKNHITYELNVILLWYISVKWAASVMRWILIGETPISNDTVY